MYCPNCRNQNQENAEYCPHCGTNLKQIKNGLQQPNINQNNMQNNTSIQNKTTSKKSNFIFIIIIVLVIALAVFGVSKYMKKETTTPKDNTSDTQKEDQNNDAFKDTSGSVDKNTNLNYDKDGAFLMAIEDVYTIAGRGTTVTGRIERGTININDEVQIIGLDKEVINTTVFSIQKFRKQQDSASVGENVGIILSEVSREDVARGQVIAKPNSIKASKKFEANIELLTIKEGGREVAIYTNFRTQLYFKVKDIEGAIILPNNLEKINPGDKNIKVTIELDQNVAMEVGMAFSIRDNGRTLGTGKITKVY